MKVTLNWLKEYVDFDWSAEELAERLTRLGPEVEGVEKRGGEFDGIVVAQVLTREKHPNAATLSVCRVQDGRGERQIVCGAANFQPGDKVPLILPGASLPAAPGEKPLTIKVGKIRGVESHGMLCSPKEVGLAEDADGLMILPPGARLGQPLAEFLGRASSDVVFELEVTSNRPDLNSVIGIAREIAALTGLPLHLPEIRPVESGPPVAGLVCVQLDAPDLCPRYTARVFRGVKIGPSHAWLRARLEMVGLRPVNNVVDATNYVMLEFGQPLNAFDYHRLAKGPDGRRVAGGARSFRGHRPAQTLRGVAGPGRGRLPSTLPTGVRVGKSGTAPARTLRRCARQLPRRTWPGRLNRWPAGHERSAVDRSVALALEGYAARFGEPLPPPLLRQRQRTSAADPGHGADFFRRPRLGRCVAVVGGGRAAADPRTEVRPCIRGRSRRSRQTFALPVQPLLEVRPGGRAPTRCLNTLPPL